MYDLKSTIYRSHDSVVIYLGNKCSEKVVSSLLHTSSKLSFIFFNHSIQGWIQQDLVGGVYQSRVGVDQRYKYMGLGVDHGAGHHRPCDQTSSVSGVTTGGGPKKVAPYEDRVFRL